MTKIAINRLRDGEFSLGMKVLQELVKRNAKCLSSETIKAHYGNRPNFMKAWSEDLSWLMDLGDGLMGHEEWSYIYNTKDELLYFCLGDYNSRTDKDLIEVIELLGDEANDQWSKLKVVEIPDGVEWYIENDNGMETIVEKHRTWN